MEVSLENYELYYQIFLAEEELYSNIDNLYLSESSTGLFYLTENVKETIQKYITKITTALQGAWNKFKEIIHKEDGFLAKIKDKISKAKPDFTIDNYQEYDLSKVYNLKVIPFNYEQMKDSLDTQDQFIDKYYPNIKNANIEGSFKEKITGIACINKKGSVKCTGEMLVNIFNHIARTIPEGSKQVEADLKQISTANNEIIVHATEIVEDSVQYYRFFREAEEGNNKPQLPAVVNNDNKPATTAKFTDGPNHGEKGKSMFVTRIMNYIKVTTDVITGKMAAMKTAFSFYMSIIKHYISPKKNNKESEESNSSNNTSTEVKTTIGT